MSNAMFLIGIGVFIGGFLGYAVRDQIKKSQYEKEKEFIQKRKELQAEIQRLSKKIIEMES